MKPNQPKRIRKIWTRCGHSLEVMHTEFVRETDAQKFVTVQQTEQCIPEQGRYKDIVLQKTEVVEKQTAIAELFVHCIATLEVILTVRWSARSVKPRMVRVSRSVGVPRKLSELTCKAWAPARKPDALGSVQCVT